MRNIFKRKVRRINNILPIPSAEEMRKAVDEYNKEEVVRKIKRTENFVNKEVSEAIQIQAKVHGESNLSITALSPMYDRNYFMKLLEEKGYTVDDFGEKIEIYW